MLVSMKSGLEDRNNKRINLLIEAHKEVSMKSGLEDRNNQGPAPHDHRPHPRLNEVRPGRPEQCDRKE